jgi:hypothetical protein
MKDSTQFLVLVENSQRKIRKQYIVSESQIVYFVSEFSDCVLVFQAMPDFYIPSLNPLNN